MTNIEKIEELRTEIRRQLEPLLGGRKCIFLDAPYYSNIGDVCIWDGARNFLRQIDANIIATHSVFWEPGQKLDPQIVIVLNGGGNFGDLYRVCQDFRIKVIETYPDNRIIMLPQSVWYEDVTLIAKDAASMGKHKDLWLCARDNATYDFMNAHFRTNHVLKVPDMAFFLSDSSLYPYRHTNPTGRSLFMRRTDKEITVSTPLCFGAKYEVHDWPTFEGRFKRRIKILSHLNSIQNKLNGIRPPISIMVAMCVDLIAERLFRPMMVDCGLNFLSRYDCITTTRLHAMILSVLLNKSVNYIDNRTGKLTDFANTWLSDIPTVKPHKTAEP